MFFKCKYNSKMLEEIYNQNIKIISMLNAEKLKRIKKVGE